MNVSDFNSIARVSDAPPGTAYTHIYENDASGNPIYAGSARSDINPQTSQAVWSIQKFTYTNGFLTLSQWANGSPSEANIWDNRASLTYK